MRVVKRKHRPSLGVFYLLHEHELNIRVFGGSSSYYPRIILLHCLSLMEQNKRMLPGLVWSDERPAEFMSSILVALNSSGRDVVGVTVVASRTALIPFNPSGLFNCCHHALRDR